MYFHFISFVFYYSVSWRICSTYCAWNGWIPSCLGHLRADSFCNSKPSDGMRISGLSVASCLFFLAYIVCMPEARPGLSMRKTPAWYRDPPPMEHGVSTEWDEPFQRFFCSPSPPTRSCSPTCLTKKLNYKQTYVLAFCSLVPNWVFLFPVRCVSSSVFF